MKHVPIVILGGGIAGLGASLRARELGEEAIIFEAGSSAGGLLDNFTIEGFRFDNAVHLSFATEPIVRNIFDQTPYYTHPSDSRCFDDGIWLKHPVQNNLYPLDVNTKINYIKSFLSRPDISNPDNYEDWLISQYGEKIANHYPIAYTKKYWDTLPKELSVNWIGNRMRRAELDEILFGAFTYETPNTYYTNEMRYPKSGGYKSFIQTLINDSKVELNSKAKFIDIKSKQVVFENNQSVTFDRLISSIPLPELTKIVNNAPSDVIQASKKLEATSIDLISVGFKKHIDLDLWFYIYDSDIYASRAYSPSVKSPDNAPAGCSSLQFEVYQRGRSAKFSPDVLTENIKYAINKLKIASGEDIVFLHHKRLPWGNVIYDIGMEENRKIVRDYFLNNEVSTCGRFGEWAYLWSNQSLLSGYYSV